MYFSVFTTICIIIVFSYLLTMNPNENCEYFLKVMAYNINKFILS